MKENFEYWRMFYFFPIVFYSEIKFILITGFQNITLIQTLFDSDFAFSYRCSDIPIQIWN